MPGKKVKSTLKSQVEASPSTLSNYAIALRMAPAAFLLFQRLGSIAQAVKEEGSEYD